MSKSDFKAHTKNQYETVRQVNKRRIDMQAEQQSLHPIDIKIRTNSDQRLPIDDGHDE